MFIFPLVYLCSFLLAVREFIRGNMQGILIYLIFGLSIYTTSLTIIFNYGLKDLLIFAQSFKEIIIILVLGINLWFLRIKVRFHFIDYAILVFFIYTFSYALLPIGEQDFMNRMLAFKTTSYFVLVYFTGRLFDPREIYISKYLHFILLLAIAAAVVLSYEVFFNQHLQSMTGFADYNFYIYNFAPSGNYGLTWTFESEGGFKRFASFFSNPLEHAAATVIALAVIAALYTDDDQKFKLDFFGWIALLATIFSITFALSRAALAGYLIVIYIWALITRKKILLNIVHAFAVIVTIYIYILLTDKENKDGLREVLLNTLDFSNPSSMGHVLEWIQGITAIIANPLGAGLGSSGRIAGSLGENIGGENQFIIIGVQTGLIALFIYIAIYIAFIVIAKRWYPRLKGKDKKVCLFILLFKIGFIIPLFTSEIESSVYISYINWFFSGLFMSIIMNNMQSEAQDE